MPRDADDASLPWDMLEGARKVRQFVAGTTFHEYGEVRQGKLWRVATVHISEPIEQLEKLTPAAPQVRPAPCRHRHRLTTVPPGPLIRVPDIATLLRSDASTCCTHPRDTKNEVRDPALFRAITCTRS